MTEKLYDERDIGSMDRLGGYYCKHISAMTGEGLHSKSAIAAELAYRDIEIDRLKALIAAAKQHGEASEDPFYKMMQILNENS